MADKTKEPILEAFINEAYELLDQLEQSIISCEKNNNLKSDIDEIFRILHTLKGNAAMLHYDGISNTAHKAEDLFAYLRSNRGIDVDVSKVSDIVLDVIDFIRLEVDKVNEGADEDGDSSQLVGQIEGCINELKGTAKTKNDSPVEGVSNQKAVLKTKDTDSAMNSYNASVYFEDGCQMENVRAYLIIQNLKAIASEIEYFPEDITENSSSAEVIKQKGFSIKLKSSKSLDEIKQELSKTAFLKEVKVEQIDEKKDDTVKTKSPDENKAGSNTNSTHSFRGSSGTLNVSVDKLDMLMDLVGELVIAESMVTNNQDLKGIPLDNFNKAAHQLKKIINDIQDVAMSIRMVPLTGIFHKMERLVRDMNKKLGKEAELKIAGDETEVDKSIIEHLADPLMHIIRNSMDHGIESPEERKEKGKPEKGEIILSAHNEGGDVWVTVKDDGKGLDREKILKKARERGLVKKHEDELTDREIYSFIFLPGFTTNDKVTEFSGRGVGMDVVADSIEKVRGTVFVDSIPGNGTTVSIKIPLTLAIIDGMNIRVGNSRYTIPITSIRESLKPDKKNIIADPDGNEMLLLRGQCYPIIKLHELYHIEDGVKDFSEGIMIMVEYGADTVCLFADELLGSQQVVIKSLPRYFRSIKGIAGCTLLGDGYISLILDIAGLVK